MSKIYKALEKAEKEREFSKEVPFPIEYKEGEQEVRQGITSDSAASVSVFSEQQLVSLGQPGSLAAEQFRKLRTYLLRSKVSQPPKTIMVTSATSNEGKTFVSTNLAIGIANHFHVHALLVDCDLRNPQVAKWFGLQNGKGLSDYLIGEGGVADFLMKTQVDKLSVIPGGSVQDNPTELIGSKKMEALVRELKSQYRDRYIVLDATPLLATTEPDVLVKLVDGVIIVVRAGVTPRETVKQAIASLDKEKILGFVLNDIQFKSSGLSSRYFGSDGYYGHYYRYGYGKSQPTPPPTRWGKLRGWIKRSN